MVNILSDSHCHLNYPALAKQRDDVIERARAAGVMRILTAATTMRDFSGVLETTRAYGGVVCSVGVHPHHCAEEGERVTAKDLVRFADDPKVVAIGETGLDYFYDYAPRDEQQRNFREHLRAAKATGLPIIVHTREAEEDTLGILQEEGISKGVLHCFSSKRFLAEAALQMGLYVSFSGMITFGKSEELRNIARAIPLDRLLVETDAPYLAPEPFRGKLCEPAHVVYTARRLAEVKGLAFDEIAQKTTENFLALFGEKIDELPELGK